MKKVVVDGEEVIFEGDVPSETSRIYQLLMEALSEQARVIYSIEVDGEPATGDTFPETYNEINVVSMSHDELTMKLSIQSLNQLSQTGKTIDAYMKNILTLPWSEVFKRMSEFIDKIQPFAELLDSISPYVDAYSPPWGKDLKKIAEDQAESLEKILQSFEQGNPALLSDELANGFIPVFNRSNKIFEDKVIPYLKEKVEAEAA